MNAKNNRCCMAKGTFFLALLWLGTASAVHPSADVRVTVQWTEEGAPSAAVPSQIILPYPLIRKGRPLHDAAMSALKSVGARFPRYLLFCTHPRLSIAELHAPETDRTFWDFSLIDPELIAFLEATKGRDPILSFNDIPYWMFKAGASVHYESDPDKSDWSKCTWRYNGGRGRELVDPSGQQVADYFARIVSWYARGGFTDELGQYHHSGYRYELPWWGVLPEPDALTPQQYTRIYDATVAAIRKVSPATKFDGLELANASPQYIEYFLDSSHHVPGTPIDMVGFHFYASPAIGQEVESWQYTAFDQLSRLIRETVYVDAIRKRLSPMTLINIGEFGMSIREDWFPAYGREAVDTTNQTPSLYWNLAAAFYAVGFIELSKSGADVVSASQLVGYPPDMIPSCRMIDLQTGNPLPELQVLRMLAEQLASSRILIETNTSPSYSDDIAAQAFRTAQGRKLLLVNKRARTINVVIESGKPVTGIETIDESGARKSTSAQSGATHAIRLQPLAVAMLAFK